MRFIQYLVIATAFVAGAASAHAGQKAVTAGETRTATATIQAIDTGNRLITLKFTDGMVDTVAAGPEVKRFNELKVGDVVTFRYYESAVIAVAKPGKAAAPLTGEAALRGGTGARPGGTVSRQLTATVKVEAIDPKVPSITVRTASGDKLSYKVEDKKNIEGVKVGDSIDITYTQALLVNVESAKK